MAFEPSNAGKRSGSVKRMEAADNAAEPQHRDPCYRAALQVCAILAAAMSVIEGGVGWIIGSAALAAAAADVLEDAATYILAVVAIGRTVHGRAVGTLVELK